MKIFRKFGKLKKNFKMRTIVEKWKSLNRSGGKFHAFGSPEGEFSALEAAIFGINTKNNDFSSNLLQYIGR